MDTYGHVNNSIYLRYMEEAQIQMLYKMGCQMDGKGLGPVIINTFCTFLKSVTYPDTLTIDCYVDNPGRSSLMSYYKPFSQSLNGILVCEGSAKIVWIDTANNKSVPLPDEIRTMIDNQSLS